MCAPEDGIPVIDIYFLTDSDCYGDSGPTHEKYLHSYLPSILDELSKKFQYIRAGIRSIPPKELNDGLFWVPISLQEQISSVKYFFNKYFDCDSSTSNDRRVFINLWTSATDNIKKAQSRAFNASEQKSKVSQIFYCRGKS